MKKIRILGIIALVIAIALLGIGILADFAKDGDGAFAGKLNDARKLQAEIDNNSKASKNIQSLEKKVNTAVKNIGAAKDATNGAVESITALDAAVESGETGDTELDALTAALGEIIAGTEGASPYLTEAQDALKAIVSGTEGVQEIADAKLLALYAAIATDAVDSVNSADAAIASVWDGTSKVFELTKTVGDTDAYFSGEIECDTSSVDACRASIDAACARYDDLAAYETTVNEWLTMAETAVKDSAKTKLSVSEKLIVMLSDNVIGVIFTAALFFIIALVLLFGWKGFSRQWSKNPVFSVFIAMLVMLVAQTYALGFTQGSFPAWAKFWFDNNFNVLRANTSIGMIALGMTLVIIIGGIDLAVGSTLAGVGTILMTMIDTGSHGVLIKLGLTGTPAYIIGIIIALAAGLAIGAVIGLLVTKGRIPAFIVTLGVMNVTRSLCQYFTKSYTATVPKEFEAIANTVIFGQRPMTIIYWAILIVIFYIVMKYTAFGRYVYAVGSNERTTRLSGINTDSIKLKVYMLLGFVVAIASITQLSRLGGMDVASAGNGFELDAIAAVVVGGTAMSGGKGSIIGTVLGVLIIGIMNNLLILLGVDSFLTDAFKGAIVVIAVLMQRKEKMA